MKQFSITKIILLSVALVLALLGVYALVAPAMPAASVNSNEPYTLELAKIETINIGTIEPEQIEDEETPAYPMGAYDVVVNGTPVVALQDRAQAEAVLWENLNAKAVAAENEQVMSAVYDCTIFVSEASGQVPVLEYDAAMQLLESQPTLIPVKVTALRSVYESGTTEATTQNDDTLAKGSRIITQLGAGAYTATQTTVVYRIGEIVETSDPATVTITDKRQSIVRVGTHTSKAAEPDKNAGAKGKDAGDIKFVYPMRGKMAKYFGINHGEMHNGIDIAASVGTAISAPADGIVIYVGLRGSMGTVVDIDHGNGFVSRLTHVQDVQVELNQRVYQGDAIGTLAHCDDETVATHLHYELLIDNVPFNPLHYIG